MGLRNDIRELIGGECALITSSQLLLQIMNLIDAPKKVKCKDVPVDPALISLIANTQAALFVFNDGSGVVMGDENTSTTEAISRLSHALTAIHNEVKKNDKQ